jgi:hypothetical protein
MHKSTIAFRLLEQMTNKVPKMMFTTSAQIAAILMLAAGLLSSCNDENDSTAYLQNMERPVICIAKKDSVSAIFKGHDGRLFVAKSENFNGSALIDSYNVGDTLR